MDRLAMNAMLARQAGLSYGKWKALQPVVPVEMKIPEGWQKCEECGNPFAPRNGRRFCDEWCRRKSHDRRKNQKKAEYMRQYRAKKKEGAEDGESIRYCPMCGKTIRKRNKIYCSESCGKKYRELRRAKKDG